MKLKNLSKYPKKKRSNERTRGAVETVEIFRLCHTLKNLLIEGAVFFNTFS